MGQGSKQLTQNDRINTSVKNVIYPTSLNDSNDIDDVT